MERYLYYSLSISIWGICTHHMRTLLMKAKNGVDGWEKDLLKTFD